MDTRKIIDITLPIENGMAIYPGNKPVEISSWHSIDRGDSSNLSSVCFGSHTGTHIDAPFHGSMDGKTLREISLSVFVGKCKVFDLSACEKCVKKEDLENKNIEEGDRVLLKTQNSIRGLTEFYDDYVFLDGDAAEYLASKGVVLVGIDSLSIKERGSKDNRPHSALLSKDIAIIEGLSLKNAPEGEYELLCLPLSLDIDGAPARVVLISK